MSDDKKGMVLSGLITILLLLLLTTVTRENRTTRLGSGQKILVADPISRTGDPGLGPRLKQFLILALSQSPHFRLYPEAELRNFLRMQSRDPRSAISPGIALQICGQEHIPTFLVPVISRAGKSFILSASIFDVRNNRIDGEHTADALRSGSETDLFRSTEDLARRLRASLGEQFPSPAKAGTLFSLRGEFAAEALRAFADARIEKLDGNRAGELEQLNMAVAAAPDFAIAQMQLASFLSQAGESREALEHIERAFLNSEVLPPREKYRIRAAYYALRRDPAGAMRENDRLLKLYRQDWEVHADCAGLSLQLSDYSRAATGFEAAIRLEDSHPEPYVGLCLAEMFRNNTTTARTVWERARHLDPEDPGVIKTGALLDLIDNNVASAVRSLQYLVSNSPPQASSDAWHHLAQAQIYGGRYEAAFASLEAGIEVDRRRNNVAEEARKQLTKARLFGLTGESDKAIPVILQLCKGPVDEVILAFSGIVLAQQGAGPEAEKILARLEQKGDSREALPFLECLRGEVALASGKHEEAVQFFRRAFEQRSGRFLYEGFPRALASAGRLEEAAAAYRELAERKAEALFPQNAPWFTAGWVNSLYDSGRCLLALGKAREAQQSLRNYLWVLDGADADNPSVKEAKSLLKGK